MIAAILFVSFAILLILGAPIAVCLGSSSVLAMNGVTVENIVAETKKLVKA